MLYNIVIEKNIKINFEFKKNKLLHNLCFIYTKNFH